MEDIAETEKNIKKYVCGGMSLHDVEDYFEIAQQRKKLHMNQMWQNLFHWWKMGSGD